MSQTIEVARVQGYEAAVHHLSQQQVSLLENRVRVRPAGPSKIEYFNVLSPAAMLQTTVRHGDTTWVDIEHTRRAALKKDFSWAQPVDEEDQLETIISPASEYAVAAAAAVGRQIDLEIVNAISGTAATGETGTGSQALPSSQIDSSAGTLTLAKLAAGVSKILERGVMISPQDMTYIHDVGAYEDLIVDTGFTSRDFTMKGPRDDGRFTTFMGLTFILMTDKNTNASFGILPSVSSTVAKTFLFSRMGVGLAVWRRVSASIDKRPDKNNLLQVLVKTHIGAVRIEDELVFQIDVTNN